MSSPEIVKILIGTGKGIVYGAIVAGFSYLSTHNQEGHLEVFDRKIFVKTVIIGMIMGGIIGSGNTMDTISNQIGTEVGVNPEVIKTFLMTGITWFTDKIVNIIWYRFHLEALWLKIKALRK
jgi:hypothetical protein